MEKANAIAKRERAEKRATSRKGRVSILMESGKANADERTTLITISRRKVDASERQEERKRGRASERKSRSETSSFRNPER